MRIDVVSIFPDYLRPLELSLLGKARSAGLIDLRTHDLRDWAHDRHRTVDDTPYGGGAGMVMRPEPWGAALDDVLAAHEHPPLLVVPTPSGAPFTQGVAQRLAGAPGLVFACGRYEGIDQRVVDHYRERLVVEEVSVGDYVLSGGEVAAMVVIEATARLLPGFVGNAQSLVEESHHLGAEGRLLEYPVYTRPPSWRGHDVPGLLLSGHHAQVEQWRHEAAVRRTALVRPDLAHPSQTLQVGSLAETAEVRGAVPADVPELFVLQRCCWVGEAQDNDMLSIPPLVETLDDVRASLDEWLTFVVRVGGRMVGSVRARAVDRDWHIGRLMVAPDLQGRGLGRWLLERIEAAAPEQVDTLSLLTGARSEGNLRMYRRAGYRVARDGNDKPGVVRLVKPH